jgi:ribulose-5-phosphate 4-epimerase/fuculose-1-phosphate aldolase
MGTVQQFIKAAHRADKQGLMLCCSGNLSWRIGENLAFVSGTGSWLSRLKNGNIAICRISDGLPGSGAKPSIESSVMLTLSLPPPSCNPLINALNRRGCRSSPQ